jgi:hypothetical protein
MKKLNCLLIGIAFALPFGMQAQEYKIAKTSGRLELNVGRVTVEGTDGNEIIFTTRNGRSQKDERAQGLRAINSLGLEDNTGLGINVADKGNVIEVHQLRKTEAPDIKVLVPKGIIVSFKHESQYGGTARFVNLPNEIEVSAIYNSVELDHVTGPLTVEATYGSVTASMDGTLKGPVSIVSIYGFIDITLPQATKADVKLNTSYGEIFAAPEFNLKVSSSEGGMNTFGDKVTGTINGGGGIKLDLTSNYGKIYLRKK